MSRKKILTRSLSKRARKKMQQGHYNKYHVGDKVKVVQKTRTNEPIIKMHGTTQEVESVFGGIAPYKLKDSLFLFREEELELVELASSALGPTDTPKTTGGTGATGCTNVVPIISADRIIYNYENKNIDYMKLISEI